jgi:hypothetical protein
MIILEVEKNRNIPEKSLLNLFCSLQNDTIWQIGVVAVDSIGNKSPFSLFRFIKIKVNKVQFNQADLTIQVKYKNESYQADFDIGILWKESVVSYNVVTVPCRDCLVGSTY